MSPASIFQPCPAASRQIKCCAICDAVGASRLKFLGPRSWKPRTHKRAFGFIGRFGLYFRSFAFLST
eukprot:7198950-Prorocentrum_lima.AAC.1